jgi:tRNA pseudouridine55 synthase
VDGVLVVDKPAGPTSHDLVDRVRRALGEKRVGHTGTLDPFATGVLPLCIGKATRLARRPRAGRLMRADVEQALAGFVGAFAQVPPAFSAKHVGGRRLYELARRGEAAPRSATTVTVHAIEIVGFADDRLEIHMRCSPGTYVRALARDLGEKLGVGGHLTALRRTRSGSFDLSAAVRADDLAAAERRLVPMAALLPELPAVSVPASARRLLKNGRDLAVDAVTSGFPSEAVERVRLVDERGELLALAVPRGFGSPGELPCARVLHPDVVLLD